ncbi:hypothetical protein ACG7TL_006622 [Trametes sanguinea]
MRPVLSIPTPAVYRPTLPFAAEHNLRLVLLNLRGYPGSTDYSPADLDKLRDSNPESQEQAMAERGLEIAEFLRWYIDTEAIPPITLTPEGISTGGISLLSWSGGNWFTVAMFGNAGKIPESTRKLLKTYLRSFVMFGKILQLLHRMVNLTSLEDPSSTVIGHSIPPGLSSLRRDASAPVDEQVAIFAVDVSAYYPPYEIPDDIDPPPTFDVPRRPLHEASAEINPKYAPTSTKMSPETLRDLTHPPIMKEYQHVLWGVNREVLKTNLHRALYDCRVDDGTGMRKPIWPDVPPVDENGTVLFYEDAGPPAGSTDYVTVVLIHGTCFHGAVYRPMIPFAAQHNLRLVMLNLRGYPGSTEYSHEDFEQLRGPSHEQQEMSIAARGIEIAAFLRWFIDTNGIPPIKDTPGGSRSGGLSLLAWSGGNCHALAMFAHIDKIPAETRSLLDAYLRTFIAFGITSH